MARNRKRNAAGDDIGAFVHQAQLKLLHTRQERLRRVLVDAAFFPIVYRNGQFVTKGV